MGRVIGFVSAKGGVGKTSIIKLISKGLLGYGKKVCIFDAYFSQNEISLSFGLENDSDLKEYLCGNQGTENVLNKVMYNLYYVKTNFHTFNYYKHLNLIKFFISEISEMFDYVLIDINSFDREIFESMIESSTEIICVCSGEEIEVRNVAKMISKIKTINSKLTVNLILNKFKVIHSILKKCLNEKEIFELLKTKILASVEKFYNHNKFKALLNGKYVNNLSRDLSYSIITNNEYCFVDLNKYKGLLGFIRKRRCLKYE